MFYYMALLSLAVAAPMLLLPPPGEGEGGSADAQAAFGGTATTNSTKNSKPAAEPRGGPGLDALREREEQVRIEAASFIASVSNLNAGLTSFELKSERYRQGGEQPAGGIDLVTTDRPRYYPLGLEFDGIDLSALAPLTVERLSPSAVRLSGRLEGLSITRKLEAAEVPNQLWVTTRIHNGSSRRHSLRHHLASHHYVTSEAEGGGIPLLPVRSPATSSALCRHADELERELRAGLDEALPFRGDIGFIGVENVYFLSAVAPEGEAAGDCRIEASDRGRDADGDPVGTLFSARMSYAELSLEPGQSHTYRALAYLGPKTPEELSAAGHHLREAIQTGWFTGLAEGLTWLLRVIFDFVGNWGFAIILLTFVVKLLLFPLTAKQMQSMAKMKELKPEMDRINELYADDREKKGAAIMELYRNRGVNPMAGCFPMLLQLPIWFSLYTSLSSNVELFRAPFALWWVDLSSPDPYFSLPLALGALMFVQQKMTPMAGTDPVQQKMMLYMMPTMMASFMLFLPAGLCLYMFTNSALSITQQRLIERHLARASRPGEAESETAAATKADSSAAGGNGKSPSASRSGAPPSEPPDAEEGSDMVFSKPRPKGARPSKAERRSRRGK